MANNIMVLIILILLLIPSMGWSATYYVSSTTASTDWETATNIGTPCTPATAFANASGNDLVYFRGGSGGTYTANGTDYEHPAYYPRHSGTSWDTPLVFKAYPGETPIFSQSTGPVMGLYEGAGPVNYITFDGFKFVHTGTGPLGPMRLSGGNGTYSIGIRLLNCEFESTENINNTDLAPQLSMRGIYGYLIQNCYFHNHRATDGDEANTTSIILYSCRPSTSPAIDAIIEKSTFAHVESGVNYKLNSSGGEVNSGLKLRYNIFYDIDRYAININYNSEYGEFYQNLFFDTVIASENSSFTSPYHKVYNNTFIGGQTYGSAGNILGTSGTHALTNLEWYNNIYYSKDNTYYPLYINTSSALSYCDYNEYYRSEYTPSFTYQGTTYNWANWTGTAGFDTHSITTDPSFVNYTGDSTGNYKLQVGSPAINTGRSGVSMGAYITGNECIGYGCSTAVTTVTGCTLSGASLY